MVCLVAWVEDLFVLRILLVCSGFVGMYYEFFVGAYAVVMVLAVCLRWIMSVWLI